jgi:adenosylcobinamide kinase/adenosylcobinamide-phosphate guanylyltransferase
MVREHDAHKPKLQGVAAMPGRIILVGGGARSGKSRFALTYAEQIGVRRVFVATAQALDDEMAQRIARHRGERQANWVTIEEPLALPETLARVEADVVLVDCLTLWLANLLLHGDTVADVEAAVGRLAEAASARRGHVVIVTNEVGMGIVPEHALGRLFRDVAGRAHQRLAASADEVYMAMLGLVVRLRPGPLVAFPPDGVPA